MTSSDDEVIKELMEYVQVLEELRHKQELSKAEESKIPHKPICLSNLQSPIRSHSEMSKDEEKQLLDKVSGLLIMYGREVLSS